MFLGFRVDSGPWFVAWSSLHKNLWQVEWRGNLLQTNARRVAVDAFSFARANLRIIANVAIGCARSFEP